MTLKIYCERTYTESYQNHLESLARGSTDDKERKAQKFAIKRTLELAMAHFPEEQPNTIWRCIYISHVKRKSGIEATEESIEKAISAHNSWVKSSGHAFEEMIRDIINSQLAHHGIKILLQKQVSGLIQNNDILNQPQDITWLKEKLAADTFDLYIGNKPNQDDDSFSIFGCLQSKTSVRERVTRDREPSREAMAHFFWSIAVVLDGDFLRLPKFKAMVNGGGTDFHENGWHGLYSFAGHEEVDRIYSLDLNCETLVSHALQARDQWTNQRQWFNSTWRPA